MSFDDNPGAAADTYSISLDNEVNESYSFWSNGEEYSLQLLGFGTNSDNILDTFTTGASGTTTNFNAYARFVNLGDYQEELANTIAVPTPAAGYMGIGALALILMQRRRRLASVRA